MATMFLRATGTSAITLPLAAHEPVQITSTRYHVNVYDQDSRLVTRIEPLNSVVFEVEPPRWWRFWRSPRWVRKS